MRITPEQLRPRTDRAITRIDNVFQNWRWSRRLGYERLKVLDVAKVSGASSNEVESITLGQKVIRDLVAQGAQALYEATVNMEKADYCFSAALGKADNRSPEVRERDLPDKPWVSKKERRHLQQAQEHRRTRGEDVP